MLCIFELTKNVCLQPFRNWKERSVDGQITCMFNTYYCQSPSLRTREKMLRQDSIQGVLYIRKMYLAIPDKMSS